MKFIRRLLIWLFEIFRYIKLDNPENTPESRSVILLYERSKFWRKVLFDIAASDDWIIEHLDMFKCTRKLNCLKLLVLKEFKLKWRTLISFLRFSGELHLKAVPSHRQWEGQGVWQPSVSLKHVVLLINIHVDSSSSSLNGQLVIPLHNWSTVIHLPSLHLNCEMLHRSSSLS